MKKVLEIALGIVTSIGGFLEAGSIATAAQAGASFGYQLGWVIALGTVCLVFLVEMSGRLAAVSKHTVVDATRERFGFRFFLAPLIAVSVVSFLVLASEIGGVALSLQIATGVRFQWWALPVALLGWLLLWKGTFGTIEKGVAILGLVTVAFVVAAVRLHPSFGEVGKGLIPSLPQTDTAKYWFTAVSILGASISPYLFYFYSSGAIEDKWNRGHLMINRITATLGMGFGGFLSVAVLVAAALVFHQRGIDVERYEQVPLVLSEPLGRWGFVLFALSLGIACFGAALEIALSIAYTFAQGFGWRWGENEKPTDAARFSLVYTVALLGAALVIAAGVDPLKLTIFSMALTALCLPVAIGPLLLLMNDRLFLKEYRNGWLSNAVVTVTIVLAFVVAIVAIPLEIVGS